MTINLHLPMKNETLRPTITVVGVGGAGGNAVNNMISAELQGVNFVTANTDAQALDNSLAERRLQLGVGLTQGLGAGASPDVGRAAAEEAIEDIQAAIEGSHMVFITAGMGGGTGTGAAPVVAKLARDQGILTVGVVTKPFQFEGTHRMRIAEEGLDALQTYVDTMIVIPNQNLFRVANERTTFADAFRMADEVLHSGVRGVTDLMVMPGLINLDFADIRAVMREMGKAMMGTGEAEGERRAVEAAEAAISNPLLDDVSMRGARGVLINITGGHDMTLFEVDEAANRIRDEVDPEANIIFGSTFNEGMEGKMRVSVVSTGIDAKQMEDRPPQRSSFGAPMPDSRGNSSGFHFGYTARKEPVKASMQKAPVREEAPQRKEPQATVQEKRYEQEREVRQKAPVSYSRSEPVAAAPVQRDFQRENESSVFVEDQDGFSFAEESHQPHIPRGKVSTQARPQADSGQKIRQSQTAYPRKEMASLFEDDEVDQHSQREQGFVAPPPQQPSHRSFYNVHEEDKQGVHAAEAISPRDLRPTQKEEESEYGSAFGFFQKVAGRAFSGVRGEDRQPTGSQESSSQQPTAEREVRSAASPAAMRPEASEREVRPQQASREDEYLEIPAFLRRQAN